MGLRIPLYYNSGDNKPNTMSCAEAPQQKFPVQIIGKNLEKK